MGVGFLGQVVQWSKSPFSSVLAGIFLCKLLPYPSAPCEGCKHEHKKCEKEIYPSVVGRCWSGSRIVVKNSVNANPVILNCDVGIALRHRELFGEAAVICARVCHWDGIGRR